MYNASEHTFNKNKTMTACLLLPVSSQGKQMIIRLRSFTEFLPCTFAMYDCRQLEDVSSVENVHMVTDLLPQVFIRCYHLYLPSLCSVVTQAFGAL